MDWSNERYVRLYTRVTVDEKLWPWEARAIMPHILRHCDRAGLIKVGNHEPAKALAALVELPMLVVKPGLDALIGDGCVVLSEGHLVVPNFVDAQEANQSDAHRSREHRRRRKDLALLTRLQQNVSSASRIVTEPTESERVTDATRDRSPPSRNVAPAKRDVPKPSHGDTRRHSVPSRAVINSSMGERGGDKLEASARAREAEPELPTPPLVASPRAPEPERALSREETLAALGPAADIDPRDDDEDPQPTPKSLRAQIYDAWCRVAANGAPMGSETAIASSLEAAVAACVAREPANPVALFEKVARIYLEQRRAAGKRISLKFLCDEFGEWVEVTVARATTERSRGAAYLPIDEPIREAK